MFETLNTSTSTKPFHQWKGFLRACTWCLTFLASQVQLGNKRHKCAMLKHPAHSSWEAPVAPSLATLAGSRFLGRAALCWALLYPLLPACYPVFRGNPKMDPPKRDYSTNSNSHGQSGAQVFITLVLVLLVTSHEQWWKSLEWYPRRPLKYTN